MAPREDDEEGIEFEEWDLGRPPKDIFEIFQALLQERFPHLTEVQRTDIAEVARVLYGALSVRISTLANQVEDLEEEIEKLTRAQGDS